MIVLSGCHQTQSTQPMTTYTGTYSAEKTYSPSDIVTENSQSYVSLVGNNEGHEPATSPAEWAALISTPTEEDVTGRVVYDKTSWSDLSDFSVAGTTPTLSSGGTIQLAGSASFDSESLTLKDIVTDSDQIDFQIIVKVDTVGQTASDGFALGKAPVTGSNTMALTAQAHFGPSPGHSQISLRQQAYGTPGSPFASDSGGAVSVAAGDMLSFTWSQRATTVTATLQNLTQGTSESFSQTGDLLIYADDNFQIPAASGFKISGLGASYEIEHIRLIDQQYQSPYLVVTGDSKVAGISSSSEKLRFGSMLPFGPVDVEGGPGDQTSQWLQTIPFIVAQDPQNVLISIGSNDCRSEGCAGGETDYAAGVAQLRAAGINIIHLLPIPEKIGGGGTDQSALQTWIETTYPGDAKIDPSVGWQSSYWASDGVHPNIAGHQFLAQVIAANAVFASAPRNTESACLSKPGLKVRRAAKGCLSRETAVFFPA
ncbi:MAG TPA: SGNH/GDSL hydrolase family protein [Acidobacteriaceae bacterium]|nr:SGNH/GDSL hydrolase family protein [Acidobacteriaceae bacterium]